MTPIEDPGELRQGDWLAGITKVPIVDATGALVREVETPHGVVVVTQCCDLAQDHSGVLQVCPVTRLSGRDHADAEAGRTTRYVQLDEEHFADLAVVVTVVRDTLSSSVTGRKAMTTASRQIFATGFSRRYSRFAYPDDLVEVLRPLSNRIRKTALKSGAIATVLKRIATMRLECEPNWDAAEGISLTLLVLVEIEHLPSLDELMNATEPSGPVRMRRQDLNGAAEAILNCGTHDQRLCDCWEDFGSELVKLFETGRADAPVGYVDSVQVEILRTDEVTYERYRSTVDLDFDYLSTPHGTDSFVDASNADEER